MSAQGAVIRRIGGINRPIPISISRRFGKKNSEDGLLDEDEKPKRRSKLSKKTKAKRHVKRSKRRKKRKTKAKRRSRVKRSKKSGSKQRSRIKRLSPLISLII